jgi:hypothetical protein
MRDTKEGESRIASSEDGWIQKWRLLLMQCLLSKSNVICYVLSISPMCVYVCMELGWDCLIETIGDWAWFLSFLTLWLWIVGKHPWTWAVCVLVCHSSLEGWSRYGHRPMQHSLLDMCLGIHCTYYTGIYIRLSPTCDPMLHFSKPLPQRVVLSTKFANCTLEFLLSETDSNEKGTLLVKTNENFECFVKKKM